VNTDPNLVDLFKQYFEVVLADTPEKLQECYRIRYKVYCEEGLIPGFDVKNYPEGLEQDEYDERSAHCLLMHKPTKRVAGTVRIVLPIPSDQGDIKFPLEAHAGNSFYQNSRFETLPRRRIGEISRLILASEFRARRGENIQPHGIAKDFESSLVRGERRQAGTAQDINERRSHIPRRTFPHPILGLFVAITRMSLQKDLAYWYGGMEPVCARFLRTFGIHFTPISPLVDYFGPCRSYIGYISEIMANLYQTNRQVWDLLTDRGILLPAPN
jgi:N-acyl amino acid synthase of PEP-CTERM/exosortase system